MCFSKTCCFQLQNTYIYMYSRPNTCKILKTLALSTVYTLGCTIIHPLFSSSNMHIKGPKNISKFQCMTASGKNACRQITLRYLYWWWISNVNTTVSLQETQSNICYIFVSDVPVAIAENTVLFKENITIRPDPFVELLNWADIKCDMLLNVADLFSLFNLIYQTSQ